MSGELPTELAYLTNLTNVKLDGNQIQGTIPYSIGSLTELMVLDVESNQLSGFIPESLWSLTKLEQLDLNANQLTGTISTQVGNLFALTRVQLQDNYLTGVIPEAMCNLRSEKLQYLSADCNPVVSFDQTTVIDPTIQCSCCTQCYSLSATVTDVDLGQFSVITCANYPPETTEAHKSASVSVLHFSYRVESSADLNQINPVLDNAITEFLVPYFLSCSSSQRSLFERRFLGIDNATVIIAYPADTVTGKSEVQELFLLPAPFVVAKLCCSHSSIHIPTQSLLTCAQALASPKTAKIIV